MHAVSAWGALLNIKSLFRELKTNLPPKTIANNHWVSALRLNIIMQRVLSSAPLQVILGMTGAAKPSTK
jgi:hypothetical protein